MKVDGRINIRVPVAEKAAWEEQADTCDMSLSDWIRMRCDVGKPNAPVVQVKPSVAPVVKPVVVPPHSTGQVVKLGRIYTGETVSKFGRVMREYVAEDGSKRWE